MVAPVPPLWRAGTLLMVGNGAGTAPGSQNWLPPKPPPPIWKPIAAGVMLLASDPWKVIRNDSSPAAPGACTEGTVMETATEAPMDERLPIEFNSLWMLAASVAGL